MIVSHLVASIVSETEKEASMKNDSEVPAVSNLHNNIQILASFIQKYPELRMLTASIIVQTSNFDLQKLSVTKFASPQDVSFLDYILHVLRSSALINSFYDLDSISFSLLDPTSKREMTSHEYFRVRIIERALYGLQLLSDPQLAKFYVETIERAIQGRYHWSTFEDALLMNTIFRVEELISRRLDDKISLNQNIMTELTRLFQILLSLNINNAFIQLNPFTAEPILQMKQTFFQAQTLLQNLTFCQAIQQYARDYERYDLYAKLAGRSDWVLLTRFDDLLQNNGIQSTDVNISQLQESGKKLDIHSIREETDNDRKSLLVRAVLEQLPLDVEYQLSCITSPYSHFSYGIKSEKVNIKGSRFTRSFQVLEKPRLRLQFITRSILITCCFYELGY